MYRVSLTLIVVLLATGVVLANAGPPRGKLVPVDHTITTEKEYANYTFYLVGDKPVAVKFDPKTPIVIKGVAGEFKSYMLVAVPTGSEKQFANEDELRKALTVTDKIEGRVQYKEYLHGNFRLPETDKRDKIVRESKVEKINTKEGIVLTTKDILPKKDGAKPDGPKQNSPDGEDSPGVSVYTPRGGVVIAALTASLALLLGGFWLVGRSRRKV